MNKILLIILSLLPSLCYGYGGTGSTCDPSVTENWGTCALEIVPFQASVTNTINVAGGTYSTPYQATTANTEYVLQGDITADGTAIEIKANYVIINLNGHTITYGKTSAGEGVVLATYNKNHIAVKNGSIIQSNENIGKIVSIGILNGGTGYTAGDTLTLTGGVDNATATVSTVDGSGVITAVALASPGKGYEVTWGITGTGSGKYPTGYQGTITGGTGSGAVLKVVDTISEGNYAGKGKAPVSSLSGTTDYNGPYAFISNLYLEIYGRDICGVYMSGADTTISNVTVRDHYRIGTLKHRDFGESAINNVGARGIVKNCTIIGARHKGVGIGTDSEVYDNVIATDNIATNGAGIAISPGAHTSIYNNTVTSRGEHPIGVIWYNDTATPTTIDVYNNLLDSKTTALGVEYAGTAYAADPTATITGNAAVGFRTTWGGNGINFHNNKIVVDVASNYTGTYSPTGAVAHVLGRGRGLMVGVDAGDIAYFQNNDITVLGETGTVLAYGVVCTYSFSDSVFFLNNTITANVTNIVIGDEYGECSGFPMFYGNTIIKSGSFSEYRAVTTQSGGMNAGTARLVSNTYSNGADIDSIDFHASGYGLVNIYYGSLTGSNFLYSYRMHDNNNASSTILREDFDPPETLSYANPTLSITGKKYRLRILSEE